MRMTKLDDMMFSIIDGLFHDRDDREVNKLVIWHDSRCWSNIVVRALFMSGSGGSH